MFVPPPRLPQVMEMYFALYCGYGYVFMGSSRNGEKSIAVY